jgi:type II secretion system protein H
VAITRQPLRVRRGFTLVEVLVTLAVIGLGLGLITLTLGHDSAAQLRTESDRLRSAIEHAGAVAQWRRTDLAFEAVADGYRFLHPAADGRWEVETDELLSPHVLPPESRVSAIGPAGGAVTAAFRLRASGRNDPFTLVLEAPAGRWLIAADPLNRVHARLDAATAAAQ